MIEILIKNNLTKLRRLMDYYTTSRFGYCLNDQRPPRIDQNARYKIIGISGYDKRPIISRCDNKSYKGELLWIVDKFTLIPARPNL